MTRTPAGTFVALTLASCILHYANTAHAQSTPQKAPAGASVTGVITDDDGQPVRGVDVVINGGRIGARSDSTGRFLITDERPDLYNLGFRKLGYQAANFTWEGRAGQTVELAIHLVSAAVVLETVNVRDSAIPKPTRAHDGHALVQGIIVDAEGQPVSGAEVQLLGGARIALSNETGHFYFPALGPGSYVLRARHLGFSPNNTSIRVTGEGIHTITLKVHPLSTALTPVEINARSGFGLEGLAWDEYDAREQIRPSTEPLITRDDLVKLGKTPLDLAFRMIGPSATALASASVRPAGPPTSINAANTTPASTMNRVSGDVCVLENGTRPLSRPLSAYGADQVDRVEFWQRGAFEDATGSLLSRTSGISICDPPQPVFVIWLRGSSSTEGDGN